MFLSSKTSNLLQFILRNASSRLPSVLTSFLLSLLPSSILSYLPPFFPSFRPKLSNIFTFDSITRSLSQQGVAAIVKIPSWPALALAAFSIASKEWLFQITKKVGDALNSQILVANAWHHRSDAFSSVLSLISIAAAISIPGLLIADSAAGILVAGMICLTGFEILFESVKQLTDTSDRSLTIKIEMVSSDVAGVLGVTQIRAR